MMSPISQVARASVSGGINHCGSGNITNIITGDQADQRAQALPT